MLVSVIVPTYNEADNVGLLARRIGKALRGTAYELVFVDDSTDATPDVLSRLAARDAHVRFEHRTQGRGLGSAVVRGFELARGEVVAVMDGDLQHPPELLPRLVAGVLGGADLVIASRFVRGGNDGGLDPARKIVSAIARYMARVALHAVRSVRDPTSGFFAFRRDALNGVALSPSSWKILVELLVRGNLHSVREVPFAFGRRVAGASKLSGHEVGAYVAHLARLVLSSPQDRRFALFAAVGTLGVGVNLLVYTALVHAGYLVTLAGFLSAAVATAFNFLLNDRVTWREVRTGRWWQRAAKYGATAAGGVALNVAVLAVLFRLAHLEYVVANLIGILASVAARFYLNDTWTWRPEPAAAQPAGPAAGPWPVKPAAMDPKGAADGTSALASSARAT